jgi:hypothetical protein
MSRFRFVDRLLSVATSLRTAFVVACSALLCEAGARIGLPGVDGSSVRRFFGTTHRGMLGLYNLLAGGATSRAAVFALGAIPWLQAQLYVWLARAAFPTVRRITAESATRRTAVRLTTVGLALVQSFGFARFLQGIPGAVLEPGIGFVGRTVLLVTSGAIAVGWLGEVALGPAADDADTCDVQDVHEPSSNPLQKPLTESEGANIVAEGAGVSLLESGALSDLSMPRAATDRELDRAR